MRDYCLQFVLDVNHQGPSEQEIQQNQFGQVLRLQAESNGYRHHSHQELSSDDLRGGGCFVCHELQGNQLRFQVRDFPREFRESHFVQQTTDLELGLQRH